MALIGFCGGPWTVATYMLQGEGGDKDRARLALMSATGDVDALLAHLVETTRAALGGAGEGRRRLRADFRKLVRGSATAAV